MEGSINTYIIKSISFIFDIKPEFEFLIIDLRVLL
jgi:hypothetical protein